jgi:hypothetical protein
MNALTIAAIVIAGAIAGFVLLGLITKLALAGVAASSKRKIAERFPDGGIVKQDLVANSLGQTSKGATQLRGNGALVLTADSLCFMGVGRDDLVIPLNEITAVTTVKWHLGKSVFRPLLKVDFGADDGIALYVEDLAGWIDAIEGQRAK